MGLFQREGTGWREVRTPFAEEEPAKVDGVLFDRVSGQTPPAIDTSRRWRPGDGGRSWLEVEGTEPSWCALMKGTIESVRFESLARDAGGPEMFYAGSWPTGTPGHAIFKTTDACRAWKGAGAGVRNEAVTAPRCGAPGIVCAISVDASGVLRAVVDRPQPRPAEAATVRNRCACLVVQSS